MENSCFNVASFMAKTLNKPNEEIADLLYTKSDEGEITLKEDAETLALELIQGKLQGIKDDSKAKQKEIADNFHKKGLKEASDKFESELKEKYGLESESQGVELVDELVEKFKVVDDKMTPDKIKLSDTYMDREKELKRAAKELEDTYQKKIEDMQLGFEKQAINTVVKKDIRKILVSLKPVLPKNERAAENQVDLFIDSFDEYDWQLSEDGDHVPIKDGKRAEDALSNAVKFKQLIEGRVPEYFDIYKQDGKGSAGNETGDGGVADLDVPKTFGGEAEYRAYLDKTTDPDKREQAYKNYKNIAD